MLNIGIDGNEANTDERVGVHQYSYELLWAIYKLQDELPKKYRLIVFLKDAPKNFLPKEREGLKYRVLPGNRFWVLTKLTPVLLTEKNVDVFFSPSHYLPPFSSCPRVCTIHDLGYLNSSEQFKKYDFWQLLYWTAISIFVSKYIITVSRFNKKDIVRHYPFASKKVFITYHGFDKDRFNVKIRDNDVRRTIKKYRIPKNYILFLGTLKPSKNIEGILRAFHLLLRKYPNISLVIAGKKGWLFNSIFQITKELNIKDKVVFTDFVSEDDKPFLIKGAKVFVSPSFWEGFGINVLEAMACGTPVVISNIAGLPEVGGKSAIYVEPNSPKSIARGVEMILKMNEEEYKHVSELSLRQARKFSWEKTAFETLRILEKATL
ncbi:hypothetical protein A2962_05120 [Candidatus Woesebacteria bacterium RIFCSPLOWO2_01_FULL_39_61]|nr:MAG: hypothetical protein A2692_03370 [Candidatus Woesebacteria bacterium RIFCSPHIGHO2_01_FULL_39_95]OGM66716.1 MAG: hypothetical protein A2962_05120 [Candidatus Woesebacteria bacterium RIFCSPLOWO2_01_FULL_39_61]OGM73787.1 MAG: hypothetical protein A3H19_02640 [Candidatus Woesebacteria bacterium RIFCSPLOWO2_12_FULL_39_9]